MEVIMMSNKFILPLQKNFEIPVIRLNEPFDLTVAFSSSILLPIWTLKESLLLEMGAKRIRRHVHFECFDDIIQGNLYELKELKIGRLIFPHLKILAVKFKCQVHIVLPTSMLKNLIYEFDDYNHKLTITIPDEQPEVRNIIVTKPDGNLQVICGNHNLPRFFDDGLLPKGYLNTDRPLEELVFKDIDYHALLKYADDNGLKVTELTREELEMFSLNRSEIDNNKPRRCKMRKLTYSEQLDEIKKELQEEKDWLDDLPADEAKRYSHVSLVKLGVIAPDGSISAPYRAMRERYGYKE